MATGRLSEYQVVGRKLPTEKEPVPKIYRMRLFAPNTVVAQSRFWYFIKQMRKLKKASGEIISVNEILEKKPLKVKNFGLWLRYDSRSGTHNMYKEYRAMSRVEAVEQMYQDMAARHRSRFRSVHILKVVELEKTADVKRPYIKQLLDPKLRFPLPSRLPKQAVSLSPPMLHHHADASPGCRKEDLLRLPSIDLVLEPLALTVCYERVTLSSLATTKFIQHSLNFSFFLFVSVS